MAGCARFWLAGQQDNNLARRQDNKQFFSSNDLFRKTYLSSSYSFSMSGKSRDYSTTRSSSRRGSDESNESRRMGNRFTVNVYDSKSFVDLDRPSHWGTMLHHSTLEHGDIYHVRKNDEAYFQSASFSPIQMPHSIGRSEVCRHSSEERELASELLDAYGRDQRNLPVTGQTSSQHWTVGAIGTLERNQLAPPGSEEYWRGKIGQSSRDLGRALLADGRSWIPVQQQYDRQDLVDWDFGTTSGQRGPRGRIDIKHFKTTTKPYRRY